MTIVAAPKQAVDVNLQIIDYWRRRPVLSPGEWDDFFQLVEPLLMRTKLPPEFNDQSRRSELVLDFFCDKVFQNASTSRANPLVHMHALHTFLRNYADDIRQAQPQCEPLDDSCPAQPAEPLPTAHEQLLKEAGIQLPAALASADRFLATLPAGEKAYLRRNTCVDDHEQAEPISAIAKRFRLGTSYHYRAERLGITLSKGKTYRGYARTAIGQWLLAAGVQLNKDWSEEIAALIHLLCARVRANYPEA